MNNVEFLEGLVEILSNPEIASDDDKKVFAGLSRIINERWITIHPHGDVEDEDGKKDYRRLKLEDGETPKEAIDRAYGKGDKPKEEKKEEPKEQPKEEKKPEEKKETAEDISKKIEELKEKAKRLGGEKTVLGQKYLKQAEELEKQQQENEQKALDDIKGDKAITSKLAEMSEKLKDIERKKYDFSLPNEERDKAREDYRKLDEQMTELSKRLSFMGDTWQSADGTRKITEFKDGKFVVTTDKTTRWGMSKEYSYYSDIDKINELKEVDKKGYEKAQKKKQEKEARISKKVEYKKGTMPKAKTQAEAEKLAMEYNLADTINYGNLSVDICNAMNESANDNYAEFPKIRSLNKEFGSLQAKNRNLIDEAFEVQGEALAIPIREKLERIKKSYGQDYFERYYGKDIEKRVIEEVKKKLKNKIGISRASGEIAHCRYSPPSQMGIVWNEKFKNIKNIDHAVDIGYHPKDSGSLKAVADHEFGHLIDRFVQLHGGSSSSPSYRELREYYNSLTRDNIKADLSGYGAEKFPEFIAEGFSEYKNSPHPRPMAVKIGKLLTQAYKETENNV